MALLAKGTRTVYRAPTEQWGQTPSDKGTLVDVYVKKEKM